MLFRQDINMIRAIAVIAVILFHFHPNLVPGGFIGVDVFFVISGFLMTNIIIDGIKKKNHKFSIIEFYLKRAYRIVPALAVLSVILLILGWFWLTPVDYRMLGKHVACSLGFISNFIYSLESGYFDTVTQEKWLLHTWSLAVEMHFYFLYPIILVFLTKKTSINKVKCILLIATSISFIIGIIASKLWPTYAYYLLFSRGWELLTGAIAYLFPWKANKKNKIIFYCGLLLITGSSFIITKDNVWPGYLAIIPVVGTFLLIQARYSNNILSTNFILQKIGTWSYSIYLWHWPLVVVIHLFIFDKYLAYIAIPLSVFLGFLSYNYIETIRFNYTSKKNYNLINSLPIYCLFFGGLMGSYIYLTNGKNANNFLIPCMQILKYPNYFHNSKNINCQIPYNLNKKPIGLLWGDSYAGHLDPFVKVLLNNKNAFISRSTSCEFPSLIVDPIMKYNTKKCREQCLACITDISTNTYDVIFLAGKWSSIYNRNKDKIFNSLIETIDFCAKHAKLVYFFATPINYKSHMSNTYMRSQVSSLYKLQIIRDDSFAQEINKKFKQAIIEKNYTNVYFVDRDILYGSKTHQDFTLEGLPYIFDDGHLSIIGSIAFAKNFMQSKLFVPLKKLLDNRL